MKKLSEKGRKMLRKFYLAFGAAAISVLFVACYGMPMDHFCAGDCDDPFCPYKSEAPEGDTDNSDL